MLYWGWICVKTIWKVYESSGILKDRVEIHWIIDVHYIECIVYRMQTISWTVYIIYVWNEICIYFVAFVRWKWVNNNNAFICRVERRARHNSEVMRIFCLGYFANTWHTHIHRNRVCKHTHDANNFVFIHICDTSPKFSARTYFPCVYTPQTYWITHTHNTVVDVCVYRNHS